MKHKEKSGHFLERQQIGKAHAESVSWHELNLLSSVTVPGTALKVAPVSDIQSILGGHVDPLEPPCRWRCSQQLPHHP